MDKELRMRMRQERMDARKALMSTQERPVIKTAAVQETPRKCGCTRSKG